MTIFGEEHKKGNEKENLKYYFEVYLAKRFSITISIAIFPILLAFMKFCTYKRMFICWFILLSGILDMLEPEEVLEDRERND